MRHGNIGRFIVVASNTVLLVRNKNVKYWHLPGGKQEIGESMLQTVRRESYEELGVNPTVGHFVASADLILDFVGVHVHENFFLVENVDDYINADFAQAPYADELDDVRFVTREELETINLVPGFLRDELLKLLDDPNYLQPKYVYEVDNVVQEIINI